MVRQEPDDVDPDRWIDEGEVMELPEVSLGERERVYMDTGPDPESPEITAEPVLDIQVIPEDPEEMAAREGIHKRIQAEIHHEDKEREDRAKEMEWNEGPDLIMEDGDILPEDMRTDERRRDEISREQRKRRKEDDIRTEKREHSPTISRRVQNPEGFYSKDWDKDKQEEDEWQAPDKFQKISQMVFCNGVLEIHLIGDGVLSSHCVQYQGGGCSAKEEHAQDI